MTTFLNEGFNSKLTNLCQTNDTHFYNILSKNTANNQILDITALPTPESVSSYREALYSCEQSNNCILFTYDQTSNTARYFPSSLDISHIVTDCQFDNSYNPIPTNTSLSFNGEKYHDISNNISYSAYLGKGMVKIDYIRDNPNRFKDAEYSINMIDQLKRDISDIRSEVISLAGQGIAIGISNEIPNTRARYVRLNLAMHNNLSNKVNTFQTNLDELSSYLNITNTNLYYQLFPQTLETELRNSQYFDGESGGLIEISELTPEQIRNSIVTVIVGPSGENIDPADIYNNFDYAYDDVKRDRATNSLEGNLENIDKKFNRKYLLFAILSIIIIICLIIFIIYKMNPNLLSDKIILLFSIGIILIIFFIHFFIK
jgi:hypothetical protein